MSSKYLVILLMLVAPAIARAQDRPIDSPPETSGAIALRSAADTEQPAGPMTIERVRSGVLIAPDFKVTRFDGRTSELVGGYGGWLSDKTFFVGGGGYWLANGSRDRRLGYGGVVLQWMGRSDETIGYSIKGLVGGGESTLPRTVTETVRVPDLRGVDGRFELNRQPQPPQSITTTIRTRQGFFIAEPEADAVIRITKSLRLTVGAGSRLIAAERGDENRLRGAVGTIGLQLGGGY
jgi:hypothetical protein